LDYFEALTPSPRRVFDLTPLPSPSRREIKKESQREAKPPSFLFLPLSFQERGIKGVRCRKLRCH